MGDSTYYSLDIEGGDITQAQADELKKYLDFDDATLWPAREYKIRGEVQMTTPLWQFTASEYEAFECEEIADKVIAWLKANGLDREFSIDESGISGGDMGTHCVYTPGRQLFTVPMSESGPVTTQYDLEKMWAESATWTEMLSKLKEWFGPHSKFDFKPDETLASVLNGGTDGQGSAD